VSTVPHILAELALFGFVLAPRPAFFGQERRNWVCLAHEAVPHDPVPDVIALFLATCKDPRNLPIAAWFFS
jgi:hypothetical protein